MSQTHLVVLFTVTAGQNGENLGSDEEQIAFFVYILFDLVNNKIIALQQHYVRPTLEDFSETVITEECKAQTGLSEDAVKNAQPLETVLDEFERFLCVKEIHPLHSGKKFCLITDGPLHLRLCLHPEASNKNIQLSSHFNQFFDLRKEFKKVYKLPTINSIKDMLEFLCLEPDSSTEYGVKHAHEMVAIIKRLAIDGHVFNDPEEIAEKMEAGICLRSDIVDDDTVVRARGLPWQSSDQDIAKFFRGLNVAKGGVALCLSAQGRRNGEALVRFENKEFRDLALRKHKHHLGQRYIEVYKANGKDFVSIAGGNSTEAQTFLSQHNGDGAQVIIRMRGLPYSCTADQVIDFFKSGESCCEVLEGEKGILFVHQADGRATGDAFVLFSSEEDANIALSKHRDLIGTRYIELFKSTTAEVQQVLNRSLETQPHLEIEANMPGLISHIPTAPVIFPQPIVNTDSVRDCIRLRGLPFEASVTDILTFLGDYARNIVFQGVHMVYNAQGTPSGEAFIQMDSEASADATAANKHKKCIYSGMKKRYIEVLQCSGEDMSLILTNGAIPAVHSSPASLITQSSNGGLVSVPSLSNVLLQNQGFQRQNTHLNVAQVAPLPQNFISNGIRFPLIGSTASISNQMASSLNPMFPYGSAQLLNVAQNSQSIQPTSVNATTILPGGVTHLNFPQPSPASQPSNLLSAALTNNISTRNSFSTPMPYQPMVYWYPSPPVSPQSYYQSSGSPCTVLIKKIPLSSTVSDILTFLGGIFEMTPDVQMQRCADGRFNGEAQVTFSSRSEAERAVHERQKTMFGNQFVDIQIVG